MQESMTVLVQNAKRLHVSKDFLTTIS